MKIKNRLYVALVFIFLIIMGGSSGYYLIFAGEYSFIDCMYMTVISLTTVGYSEVIRVTGHVPAQIFTMVLLTFGVGVLLYSISMLTALVIEGELSGMIRKRKMERKIRHLNDHYIICGGGETGFPLAAELVKNRIQVVMVEQDEDQIQRIAKLPGLFHIKGDATDDGNLVSAGIARAAGIMICLPSDNDNLYITMTARMLNSNVRIITRMTNRKLRPKLLKAGANSVVSPNDIGAMRMASEVIRPDAVEFFDSLLMGGRGNLRINQITVSSESTLSGKPIMESGLRDRFNLLVLGVRQLSGEILFSPPSSFILEEGMILIVLGEVDDIIHAKSAF